MAVIIDSHRTFEIWLYTASHSQLLLRANPSTESEERIEVLFTAVNWMALPADLNELVVNEVDSEERSLCLRGFQVPLGVCSNEARVFLLSGDGYRGIVVASGAFVSRDNLSHSDPSAFYEHNLSIGVHIRP